MDSACGSAWPVVPGALSLVPIPIRSAAAEFHACWITGLKGVGGYTMGVSTSKGLNHLHDKERQENMDNRREEFENRLLAYRRSMSTPCEGSHQMSQNDDDDVIFHVGTDTVMRITAKKSVLARKNEVFHAMFYGSYSLRHRGGSQQLINNQVEHIDEPDVDGRAFKNLISYLNGEKVELRSVVTAVETLHAAEKYLCDGLMKICATYLAGQLSPDNVLQIYRRARFYAPPDRPDVEPSAPSLEDIISDDDGQLQKESIVLNSQQSVGSCWCSFLVNECLKFIDTNASAVLTSEEFEELEADAVEEIVSRDDLCVRSEVEILTALIQWSVFECHRRQLDANVENQRRVLDRLLWHVRFLATPFRELWETPIVALLLTEQESSALLLAAHTMKDRHQLQQQAAVECLPEHIRAHWPRIGRPRKYLPVERSRTSADSLNNGPHPSCRKNSGITEKIFVGLACIFE